MVASSSLRRFLRGAGQLLAVVGVIVGLFAVLVVYIAVQPRTLHEDCLISAVDQNPGGRRTLPSLTVHSSCGEMKAPTYFRMALEIGRSYDITTRGWAWERQTITDVDASR